MNFVAIALEEINDSIEANLRYNALSTRLSKLENDEFEKFMKEVESEPSKPLEIDHEAQMRQFLQG